MRRFLTAALLVALATTAGACTDSDGSSGSPASPGASSAAAASSSTSSAGNTKEICAAVNTLVNDADLDGLGKQLGAIGTARRLKNAEAETAAKNGIKTQAATWAKQLGDLRQRATDPALQSALGDLATALTTVGTDEYLAKIPGVEDAAMAIAALSPGLDAVKKICG